MLATKRVALTIELLKMEEPAETIVYAIDTIMEAAAFEYAYTVGITADKLIKKARRRLKKKEKHNA